MTSPDTTRLDTTITREINAWPPAGLANDDQIANLSRSIVLALLAEGQIQHLSSLDEFWIIEDKVPDKRLSWRVLVVPLGGSS